MTEVVLAVDIGGTKTAAAFIDAGSGVVATATAPTPGSAGPTAIVQTVAGLAAQLRDARPDLIVRGAGIASAGVVDTRTGRIVSSTDTLAGWAGTPLADDVRAALGGLLPAGAPLTVQNDVDAHAAGEFRFGAAAGASSALVIAVGTGIGAGIIIDGVALTGAHHVGGEIAHVPVPGAEHLRCPCGRSGHLEAIGSGVGLHRHYLSLGGSPDVVDARQLASRAAVGDALAARAIAESATVIGRTIAGAAAILDPECVVLSGGVPAIGAAWWEPMRAAYRAEAIDALQDTPLRAGLLGGDAPLRGTAAHTWDQIGASS